MKKKLNKQLFVLLLLISNNLYAQPSIYGKIEEIYNTNTTNLDSLKNVILSIPNQDIDVYKFQKIVEKYKKQDTSFLCRLKTFYFIKHIFKEIKNCQEISIPTRVFYRFQLQEFYAKMSSEKYVKEYKEDYNSIFTGNASGCFSLKEFYEYSRTIQLYQDYISVRPQLLQNINRLRAFRIDSIYQYNDLILKYILKSPDSVDFSKYKTLAMDDDFDNNIVWEAMYTLAWFDDMRVAPYLEKLGKTIGLTVKTPFDCILLSSFNNRSNDKLEFGKISLRLRLWFMKGLLQNKEILQEIHTINDLSDGIDIIPFDYYIVGDELNGSWVGFFHLFFPADYEKLTIMKNREEQYKYVQNFIEKKLKELKK